MTEAATDPESLRGLIVELVGRMVKALDAPDGKPAEQGKDTATFSNLCSALDRACDVYKLFKATGDFDKTGSALPGMNRRFHDGSGNKGNRGNGTRRRGNGAQHGAVERG